MEQSEHAFGDGHGLLSHVERHASGKFNVHPRVPLQGMQAKTGGTYRRRFCTKTYKMYLTVSPYDPTRSYTLVKKTLCAPVLQASSALDECVTAAAV